MSCLASGWLRQDVVDRPKPITVIKHKFLKTSDITKISVNLTAHVLCAKSLQKKFAKVFPKFLFSALQKRFNCIYTLKSEIGFMIVRFAKFGVVQLICRLQTWYGMFSIGIQTVYQSTIPSYVAYSVIFCKN